MKTNRFKIRKPNKSVETENDRRITGLAEQAPRPSALSAHDCR
jgi:hypothetical protein